MKILFVASGNSGKFNPLIQAQYDSIKETGLSLDYELIVGKGVLGYLRNVPRIRKKIKEGEFDIVHAHFSHSAIATALAFPKNTVVSLMGSDLKKYWYSKYIIKFFVFFLWKRTIVKSKEMYNILRHKDADVLPNGVNLEIFKPIDKRTAQEYLNWDPNKKHILFAGNPQNKVKNFILAHQAIELIRSEEIEVHFLIDIPHCKTPYFFNAADVVLLTSLWEGSPNVIKEALACNRPIVSTDCGDVRELFNNVDGCFVTDYAPVNVANGLKNALKYETTMGRERIKHLDSRLVAKNIVNIYREVLVK